MVGAESVQPAPKHALQKFVVRYGTGQTVYGEGDTGATMYIVQSGKVRLFRGANGQERVIGVMEKGDFFGEMSILEGLPRDNSARVEEEAELIEINSTTFDKMIRSNIEIAIRLLRKLSIRLRESERRFEEFQANGNRGTLSSAVQAAPVAPPPDNLVCGVRLQVQGASLVFAMRGNETLIGRYDPVTELKPDVDLTEADLKRSVSRRHARVIKTGDTYAIVEEVGALNGTFVNSKKLVTGQAHPIKDGDEVGVGMVKLVFRV